MTTLLDILAAKGRYERHRGEHKCRIGDPCPERVKLWQDYMKSADYWGRGPAKKAA